jgi:hypothetical protein
MRISLLLIAAVLFVPLAGCGSVNQNRSPQQKAARLNPKDPLMTSRYLKQRETRSR